MFALVAFTFVLYTESQEYEEMCTVWTCKWFLWLLNLATALFFASTLRTIYLRWRTANVHSALRVQERQEDGGGAEGAAAVASPLADEEGRGCGESAGGGGGAAAAL